MSEETQSPTPGEAGAADNAPSPAPLPDGAGGTPAVEAGERAEFQEQTRAHRLAKLEALRGRGIDPYPVRFDRDATAAELREESARWRPAPTPAESSTSPAGSWASAATAASTSPTSATRPARSS